MELISSMSASRAGSTSNADEAMPRGREREREEPRWFARRGWGEDDNGILKGMRRGWEKRKTKKKNGMYCIHMLI